MSESGIVLLAIARRFLMAVENLDPLLFWESLSISLAATEVLPLPVLRVTIERKDCPVMREEAPSSIAALWSFRMFILSLWELVWSWRIDLVSSFKSSQKRARLVLFAWPVIYRVRCLWWLPELLTQAWLLAVVELFRVWSFLWPYYGMIACKAA